MGCFLDIERNMSLFPPQPWLAFAWLAKDHLGSRGILSALQIIILLNLLILRYPTLLTPSKNIYQVVPASLFFLSIISLVLELSQSFLYIFLFYLKQSPIWQDQ